MFIIKGCMMLPVTRRFLSKAKTIKITGMTPSRTFLAPITSTCHPKSYLDMKSISLSLNNNILQLRKFSSEQDISTLIKNLEREINAENEVGNCNMPEHLSELYAIVSNSWSILVDDSSSSSATVKLVKKEPMNGGGKVSIVFHCQDTIDFEEDHMFESDDNGEEEQRNNIDFEDKRNEEESPSTKFDIYVSRLGMTMKLTCSSQDSQVSVDSVITFKGKVSDEPIDEDSYRGPNLDELPEDLQEGFSNYVIKECGVNEDVAVFVTMFADYQEQKEYIKWLKDVKKIIE